MGLKDLFAAHATDQAAEKHTINVSGNWHRGLIRKSLFRVCRGSGFVALTHPVFIAMCCQVSLAQIHLLHF